MSDENVQFKLMLPCELKALLEEEARLNRRSVSAEILVRLESTTASKAPKKLKGERFSVALDAELLERVDAFSERIGSDSRSGTIRTLITFGLSRANSFLTLEQLLASQTDVQKTESGVQK